MVEAGVDWCLVLTRVPGGGGGVRARGISLGEEACPLMRLPGWSQTVFLFQPDGGFKTRLGCEGKSWSNFAKGSDILCAVFPLRL